MLQIHPPSEHRSAQRGCPVGAPGDYCFVNWAYPYRESRARTAGVSFQGLPTESGEVVNTWTREIWADSFCCQPPCVAVWLSACSSAQLGWQSKLTGCVSSFQVCSWRQCLWEECLDTAIQAGKIRLPWKKGVNVRSMWKWNNHPLLLCCAAALWHTRRLIFSAEGSRECWFIAVPNNKSHTAYRELLIENFSSH